MTTQGVLVRGHGRTCRIGVSELSSSVEDTAPSFLPSLPALPSPFFPTVLSLLKGRGHASFCVWTTKSLVGFLDSASQPELEAPKRIA
jgi:hypothetical protein